MDAKGRVSISRVKQNTAENAVKKGRARWVGPNAIQHTDVFEGSEVTFDYQRHFQGDCLIVYGDALKGEFAERTLELIEEHNNKYNKLRPDRKREEYIAELAARELGKVEYFSPQKYSIDEIDQSLIGMIYVLSKSPMVSRYMIKRIMLRMVRLLEYSLPMKTLIPCMVMEPINKRAVATIKSKIKNGLEYRPVIVKTDDANRFRPLRGREFVETATALAEMGISHIKCKIIGDSDLIIRTRIEALMSKGLIKNEHDAPYLTETAYRIVRKTGDIWPIELNKIDSRKALAPNKEKNPVKGRAHKKIINASK
ncbi:MAG: hypothetical protein ACOY46_02795 [Bacillota bacterium]